MKKRGKSFFNPKKAAITNQLIFILIQVSMAIVIFWSLVTWEKSVADNTIYEKIYLSKDVALVLNTIYSSPGDIYYVYSNENSELSIFNFEFKDQKLYVGEDKKGEIPAEHPFADNINITREYKDVKNKDIVIFSKNQDSVRIS